MGEHRRTILITGASAGIGAALARECAGRGYDLILTARREGPLLALAEELTARHGVVASLLTADWPSRARLPLWSRPSMRAA